MVSITKVPVHYCSNALILKFISSFQTPTNSPLHVPATGGGTRTAANGGVTPMANGGMSNSTSINSEVVFRDGTNSNSQLDDPVAAADDEPIAPIRPPIHSKTKNWYSGFCNRWASLMGVRSL